MPKCTRCKRLLKGEGMRKGYVENGRWQTGTLCWDCYKTVTMQAFEADLKD
jgi:hypothetical protein